MKTKLTSGTFWSKNFISWLVYGVGALLLSLMQASPHLFPTVFGARPTPLVLLVVCVALFNGPRVGAVIGILSGLLWDLYAFHLFGLNGLILLLIGVTVGLLVEWLLRANLWSAMLLSAGAILVQTVLEWFVSYIAFWQEQPLSALLYIYLPNALYTFVLSPIIYLLVKLAARFIRRCVNRS